MPVPRMRCTDTPSVVHGDDCTTSSVVIGANSANVLWETWGEIL